MKLNLIFITSLLFAISYGYYDEFEKCNSDYNCSSLMCRGYVCNDYFKTINECTIDEQCSINYYCNKYWFNFFTNGNCWAKRPDGTRCFSSRQCMSNDCLFYTCRISYFKVKK